MVTRLRWFGTCSQEKESLFTIKSHLLAFGVVRAYHSARHHLNVNQGIKSVHGVGAISFLYHACAIYEPIHSKGYLPINETVWVWWDSGTVGCGWVLPAIWLAETTPQQLF